MKLGVKSNAVIRSELIVKSQMAKSARLSNKFLFFFTNLSTLIRIDYLLTSANISPIIPLHVNVASSFSEP